MNMARNFKEAIAEMCIPHSTSPINEFVTVSLGIATCQPSVNCEPAEMVRLADEMLYKAKAEGRNCIRATSR